MCNLYINVVFQEAECNAVNASWLLNLINKQQLSDIFNRESSILNPYLPQKSENLRPNSSNSFENVTPL